MDQDVMYVLVIDRKQIRIEDTVKPLIEEMTDYAQGTEFKEACIRSVHRNRCVCGHQQYSEDEDGLRYCGEMICWNYVGRHR